MNVGVIGCGRVAADLHLPALRQVPGVRALAVADVDPARAALVADAHGVPARHTDYRELLDDRSIDAVAVCTPPGRHAEIALAALDAGKHVLVEKPLALSAAHAGELVERAAGGDRVAMVGFNLRFHPLVRGARRLIADEALGAINLFRSVLAGGARLRSDAPSWVSDPAAGGGALLEQGVHHFDLCRLLLATEAEEVFAVAEPDGVAATVSVKTDRGVVASMSFSQATNPVNEIDLYGTAGRLHISCLRFDGLEWSSAATVEGEPRARLRGALRRVRRVGAATRHLRHGGVFRESYVRQWAHFSDCVRRGVPAEATFEDGRRALEIALAATESASAGAPVPM
jgi:predicted dehydrogenase